MNYVSRHVSWQSLTKVPKITGFFWVIKILTTAMGEATSDFLVNKFNPVIAVFFAFIVLVVALKLQFTVKKYVPWAYWFAVVMVAVFGTMAADGLHIELGVPYILSTCFYALALLVIFVVWYKSEKTLSIHSIRTPKREVFYWLTVLATFALGTAMGDLTATTFNLGYFTSGIMFIGIFLIPTIGYWLKFNPIFTFWFAYIVTRPLGASFADWFGKSKSIGGLGFGDGSVSLILTAIIIILVVYMSITHTDAQYDPQG
jgi:uncharacterized membrane-anchored protein